MIKNIAITGGTHGNEFTGVYLVKKWQNNPELVKRSNFETIAKLTNERAIKEVRRYVDQDLNRSFSVSDLADDTLDSHEAKLAKELNELLGKKGSDAPKVDFIVDLHTTTANMGLSIIVSNPSTITWRAIAYLCKVEPLLKVYRWQGDIEDCYVNSMAPHGFAIEVGAVPQGVLRADLFLKTEALIYHLLDYVEKENNGEDLELEKSLEIYDHDILVDYPRDEEGDIVAMVHQERQDRDFTLIQQGDPLFLTLENKTVVYEGEPRYTIFINEAAYYEKGFAMTLAKKKLLEVPIHKRHSNQTELANTINDENIETLVRVFYPMVLKDTLVGPFFVEKLGGDIHSDVWEEHLVLISQFWAFVALGDERYNGHPMAPHFEIKGISREAFEQWLKLFHEAVDKVYIPRSGEFFKLKSIDIASNFMRNLGI